MPYLTCAALFQPLSGVQSRGVIISAWRDPQDWDSHVPLAEQGIDIMRKFVLAAVASTAALGLVACDAATDAAEEAGELADEAANATAETVEGAAEATGDVVEGAAEATGDAVEDAAEATGDAVEGATETAEGAVEAVTGE